MRTLGLLLDRAYVLLVDLEVHRDGSGLDRDTTLLLILSCVRKPHVSCLCGGDDTSF